MNELSFIPDTLTKILDRAHKKSGKFILFFCLVFVQFNMLHGYSVLYNLDEVNIALAQDGSTEIVDENAIYQTNTETSYVTTGDRNSNIKLLKKNESVAIASNAVTVLTGTDIYVGANARADEVDLNPIARKGLFNVVNDTNMAMLIDPVGVDIPRHMARQWLPGYESKSDMTVFAQGAGYNFLRDDVGLEPVWQMFRNISYAGFVLILMAAGFMIMFRSKIGGQVTVGIMNTIPGVILGLVLVTFSFAIVGFILDLGRLSTFLLISMLDSSLGGTNGFNIVDMPNSPFILMRDAFTAIPHGRKGLFIAGGFGLGGLALAATGVGTAAGLIVGSIGLLILLAILVIALYASIKIFAMLMTTYVKIIIDLIFGPLYILMGSLPGKTSAIMDWIKRVVANTLVFPATAFAFNLVRYLGYSSIDITGPIRFMGGGEHVKGILPTRAVLVIAGLFLISGIPDIIQEFMEVTTPKGVMQATEKAKKTAGKIPIVGGLVGG